METKNYLKFKEPEKFCLLKKLLKNSARPLDS